MVSHMSMSRLNRDVIVHRSIDLDVRWDQFTDRLFLHDTLGDEIIVVSRETLCEIMQVLDTMQSSAL